jgi:acetyl-CoA carboxylase biotin carboxyl carrier protein
MTNPADIERIVQILRGTSIRQFELENRDGSISLRREPSASSARPVRAEQEPVAAEESPPRSEILADRVGTFRRSSAPGAPPLVSEGDEVSAGQVVGFIHALGQPYEVVVKGAGRVAEILIENDHPVQYGQPLIRLEG